MTKSDLDRRRDSLQDLLGGSEGRSLLDKMNQGMREVSPQSVRSQVLDKVPEVPTFATAVPSRASCSPFIETHAKDAPVMAPVLEQRSYVRAPKVDNSRVNLMSGLVESETHVCFSRRGLTDADVPSIIKLMDSGKIVDLILAKNEIGDDGAVAIASALLHNKSILHLSLAGNLIGERGGLAFAKVLAANNTLKSLFLSSNDLGDTANRALLVANAERSKPMCGLNGLVLGIGQR